MSQDLLSGSNTRCLQASRMKREQPELQMRLRHGADRLRDPGSCPDEGCILQGSGPFEVPRHPGSQLWAVGIIVRKTQRQSREDPSQRSQGVAVTFPAPSPFVCFTTPEPFSLFLLHQRSIQAPSTPFPSPQVLAVGPYGEMKMAMVMTMWWQMFKKCFICHFWKCCLQAVTATILIIQMKNTRS